MEVKHRKIVLYGAGFVGQKWLEKLGKDHVLAFSDSNSALWGKTVNDKIVLSHQELQDQQDDILIFPAVSQHLLEDVIHKIREIHLDQYIVFTPYVEGVKAMYGCYCGYDVVCGGKNYLGKFSCISHSELGYASYIGDNTKVLKGKIGKYTAIGPDVSFVIGRHPAHDFVSVHPAFYSVNNVVEPKYVSAQFFDEYQYVEDNVSVVIGNDVWIGTGSRIMEGVKIADGTIVAAGAVVTKDTEPYSIVGGVPAKLISYRFEKNDIDFLLDLRWWEKDEEWIMAHAEYFKDIKLLRKKLTDAE